MENLQESTRKAKHAGSWYPDRPSDLREHILRYLGPIDFTTHHIPAQPLRGLIVPHAGYRYSGPSAGYAYRTLKDRADLKQYKRVIVMGPSHKLYIDFVATTECSHWETPLGALKID